jgi:hypothetical protein
VAFLALLDLDQDSVTKSGSESGFTIFKGTNLTVECALLLPPLGLELVEHPVLLQHQDRPEQNHFITLSIFLFYR